jgi:drug/metabolite transporter (DMT)-like permease
VLSVLLALCGAFSQALASLLQRLANLKTSDHEKSDQKRSGLATALYLVRQPLWLLGMLCMGGTLVFTAAALYFGALARVQPVLVFELIFTLGLRVFWLHERIAARTWGAACLLSAGLIGFLVVADPVEGTQSPTAGGWMVALGSVCAVIGALVVFSFWGSPARRAALLGASAALVWAVDAAFVKAATGVLAHDGWSGLLVHWTLYAAIASGVIGTVLLEFAFAAGPLAASQSALLIVDPLASIAIGIGLFGEKVNNAPGAVLLQAVCLVTMFVGVVLLSKWAPPESEVPSGREARSVPAQT